MKKIFFVQIVMILAFSLVGMASDMGNAAASSKKKTSKSTSKDTKKSADAKPKRKLAYGVVEVKVKDVPLGVMSTLKLYMEARNIENIEMNANAKPVPTYSFEGQINGEGKIVIIQEDGKFVETQDSESEEEDDESDEEEDEDPNADDSDDADDSDSDSDDA